MKRKTILFAVALLGAIAGCTLFSSCFIETCNTANPYYCGDFKCCAYPYTDGHGYCYQTLSDCQRSGYTCHKCELQ